MKMELGNILTGVAAFITAIVTFFKYRSERTNTPAYIAAQGNAAIIDKINEIKSSCPDAALVTVAEVTNGGGIPEIGKPLYIKANFSTDTETLLLFGEKYLMEGTLVSAVSRTILKGDTFFVPSEISDNHILSWFEEKGIQKTYFFLIGIEQGKRVLILIVNMKSMSMMTQQTYFRLVAATKQIKNIIAPPGIFKKKLID